MQDADRRSNRLSPAAHRRRRERAGSGCLHAPVSDSLYARRMQNMAKHDIS